MALLHESELARTDPDPQFLHRPMRDDTWPAKPSHLIQDVAREDDPQSPALRDCTLEGYLR